MDRMMQFPRATTLMTTYASLTGSIMLIQTMANQIIPRPVKDYLHACIARIFKKEFGGNKFLNIVLEPTVGLVKNELFEAAEIYLSTIESPNVTQLQVSKVEKSDGLSISVDKDQEVCDTFKGIKVTWRVGSKKESQVDNSGLVLLGGRGMREKESTFLVLRFEKVFKEVILNEYLRYVVGEAKKEKERNKTVKLYTLEVARKYDMQGGGGMGMYGNYAAWGSLTLDHPATFDTMAMDSELKKAVMDDLDRFVSRREFYRRVGKAWKRGYLLYGPPGTGKSSLIAAIANYLKFDVYDIELTSLRSDAELRRTLLSTSNRSIIVIEDIDCSEKMHKRADATPAQMSSYYNGNTSQMSSYYNGNTNELSLSGMLNFADGLWSSCGDERIIIFTTNHKDKIDPALLRPGRMDMHIHMSYCSSESFKILASRYLGDEIGGDGSRLICEIESLIETVEVTPAEVAEELMKHEGPDLALQGVSNLIKRKASEMNGTANDGMNVMVEGNLKESIGNGSNFTATKKPKTSPA